MKKFVKTTLIICLGLTVVGAFGQEYDDMYFTKKDRVKEKKIEQAAISKRKANDNIDNYNYDYNYDNTNSELSNKNESLSFLGRQYQYDVATPTGDVSESTVNY